MGADNEPQSRPEPHPHELTPDRPPHPVDVEVQGAGDRKPKRPRGFAAMDRKLVSEIARKGGKAAHSAGTAFLDGFSREVAFGPRTTEGTIRKPKRGSPKGTMWLIVDKYP